MIEEIALVRVRLTTGAWAGREVLVHRGPLGGPVEFLVRADGAVLGDFVPSAGLVKRTPSRCVGFLIPNVGVAAPGWQSMREDE